MYDPWLDHQLRLADRRTLLTGRKLSRVQDFALDLVLVAESRTQAVQTSEAFKLAVISADPARFIPLVYPEWSTSENITEDDLAESEGSWAFPDLPDFSPEDADALLDRLLADNNITLTGEHLP